jgi:hypothetical protein
MARINCDTFQQVNDQTSSGGVGFFSLKNDGDEAVVRILHNSPEDFDIIAAHPIKVGEYFRKAACLRNPNEPSSKCPLCAADVKLQYRIFVHMIQYTKDENGAIVAKPVVWERSARDMSQKLVTMLQEYGPLSECVFKIRRNGKSGDMQTTYEILYANPNIYRPDLYPMDGASAFEKYDALGTKVYDKNYDELVTFLNTGSFPNTQQSSTTAPQATQPAMTAPTPPPAAAAPTTGGYVAAAPSATDRLPFGGGVPVGSTPVGGRPNRYY